MLFSFSISKCGYTRTSHHSILRQSFAKFESSIATGLFFRILGSFVFLSKFV